MTTFDAIVIGNGVLGLSTAVALVEEQPGLRVALIGPSDRLLAASPASGAMLGCFGEVTQAQLSSTTGREKLALNVAAAAMWPDWVRCLDHDTGEDECLHITPGTYVLLNAKSGEMDDRNFGAIKDALKMYGKAFEVVDGREIPSLRPLEDCRPIEAIYIKDEGSIDSGQLLRRLTARLSLAKEITSVNGRVAQMHLRSNSIQNVELEDGSKIAAPLVLIAAGFESQRLIDQIPDLTRRIPRLFPGAGTAVLLKPHDAIHQTPCVIRTPNRAFACGLHAVPRLSGAVYVGATNHIRMLPLRGPTAYDVHFLIECAMEQIDIDLHLSSLEKAVLGHRPVSIDGFPLIGRTSVSGLWLLTGTYREGLHLAPLLSRHVAREMLGKEGIFRNPFQPERRPITTLSKAEAIKGAAEHHMAITYEHSARMPGGWNQQVHELFEDLFKQFYDEIDSDYVLPVEFLPMILNSKERHKTLSFLRKYYSDLAN
jgi:glycine oxidase